MKVPEPQLPNLQPKLTAHALHAGGGGGGDPAVNTGLQRSLGLGQQRVALLGLWYVWEGAWASFLLCLLAAGG